MPEPIRPQWMRESCDLYTDPESGARIVQLTSAAMISNNIYGEQPYTSPDGKRVAIVRCHDFCFDRTSSVLVHDLDRLWIQMVERSAMGTGSGCIFNAAWSGMCHYWNANRELIRFSLVTLEKKTIYAETDTNVDLIGMTVSPDQRYVVGTGRRLTGPGSPVCQIVRLDIAKGAREVILEVPEVVTHLQFNPVHGRQILVQHNRGTRMNRDGAFMWGKPHPGLDLFVIDADGSNQRHLAGTTGITGHECFIADTGRVLFSTHVSMPDLRHWSHKGERLEGNLFTVAPGDDEAAPFVAPKHFFNHISVSRCGRYFVADSVVGGGVFGRDYRIRPASLVVGDLQTGKYRTVVENSMATSGGNQCTHTHPYLTADNRWVIYNATPGGSVPQVFGAQLAEGFLESLG